VLQRGGFVFGVSGIAKWFVLDRHREAVGRNRVQIPARLQDNVFTSHVEYHRPSWIGRNVFHQPGLLEILPRHQLGLFDKEAKDYVGGDDGCATSAEEFADQPAIMIRMNMGEKYIG